jgi:integrase
MSDVSDKIDLRGDGRVVLYKRDGLKNPKWQARISVPNSTGYKIVSTKTTQLHEAQNFAANLYEELYFKVKAGGSLKSKTFGQVLDEWVKSPAKTGTTRNGGTWDRTVKTLQVYAADYFRTKPISEITSRDFSDYWEWRRTNFKRRPPSPATLRRECIAFSPVFQYACQKGYLTEIPDFNKPKAKLTRRSTFTDAEWKAFYTAARNWVEEGKTKATYRERFVAQQYFLILANTGLRIGEARNLRWSDLKSVSIDGKKQLKGWVSGKTGVREFAFQPRADAYVKRLYDLRTEELGQHPGQDDLVICHKDGKPIQSFKVSFKSLMDFANLPIVRNGIARSIYSLRHFYATKRLENEVSPFLLAKQMGTSVEMLEKFYGQTSVNASTMKSISRGNQSAGQNPDPSKKYPFE